jgi:hypothetical protein
MVTVQSGTKAFVKATVVLAAMALAAPVLAEGRAGDHPLCRRPATGAGQSRRTRRGSLPQVPAHPRSKPAARSSSGTVPVPRAKPGSKAAKRDADLAKKQAAKQQGQQAEESSGSVPVPRAKPKQARTVEAGLPVQGGEAQALVRGNLEKEQIKEILVGKTIISRIDGKEARITLGTAGKLVWRSSAGSGNGFWWTENGRVCDRYDPSGDFPGRGAGCRSFEQRGGDYYAGGRRVNFVN